MENIQRRGMPRVDSTSGPRNEWPPGVVRGRSDTAPSILHPPHGDWWTLVSNAAIAERVPVARPIIGGADHRRDVYVDVERDDIQRRALSHLRPGAESAQAGLPEPGTTLRRRV